MIGSINRRVFGFLRLLIAAGVMILVGMLFMQVILRYVFNFSFGEIDELSRYMFIWIIFLGISLGYRENAHLGVTALTDRLNTDISSRVLLGVRIITIVFMGALFVAGCKMAAFTMGQKSSTLLIPMGYIYASVPTGALLCFLTEIEKLFMAMTHREGEV